MTNKLCLIALVILNLLFLPRLVMADVVISEIMYDLPDTDAKREWVELFNNGSDNVDLTGWKFNDGSNHNLTTPPDNGGQGNLTIPGGGFIILASDANTFLSENEVSVSVIDTVMAPANTTDTLSIIDNNGVTVSIVTYDSSLGAAGDGNSLQRNSSDSFISALPTPGATNKEVNENPPNSDNSEEETSTTSTTTVTAEVSNPTNSSSGGTSSAHSGSATLSSTASPIKFEVSAGREQISVVGNLVSFDAVVTRGGDFSNPSFTWSFGDGTNYVGKSVKHSYALPGVYEVVLNAVTGIEKAVSRTRVTVTKPEVEIELIDFLSGYLILKNKSSREVNIGDWKIGDGSQDFVFPTDTLIVPGGNLPVAFGILGFTVGSTTQNIFLKDPQNKNLATTLNPLVTPGQSDHLLYSLAEIESRLALISNQVNILASQQSPFSKKEKVMAVEDEPTKIVSSTSSNQMAGVGTIPIVIDKPASWYDSFKNIPSLGFKMIHDIIGR